MEFTRGRIRHRETIERCAWRKIASELYWRAAYAVQAQQRERSAKLKEIKHCRSLRRATLRALRKGDVAALRAVKKECEQLNRRGAP